MSYDLFLKGSSKLMASLVAAGGCPVKIKIALGLAAILVSAFFLAEHYRNARSLPSDFRDAPADAIEQLRSQNAAGGERDLSRPEIPAPEAVRPAVVKTPETGAVDQGADSRYYSEHNSRDRVLAEAVGVKYPCYVEVKQLGKTPMRPNQQWIWKRTYDDGSRRESVVVKRFGGTSLANQWFMKLVSLGALNYERSARKLFDNAVAMTEKFRNAGLKTLEIIQTDSEKMIVTTKFAKGEDMAAIFRAALQGDSGAMQSVEKIGAALAAAHRNDFAVGDFNTGNGMIVNGEFRFVDVDRASVGGSKGWDIVLPFYHAILLKPVKAESEAWALIARTFLKGYLAGGGNPAVIKEGLSKRYSGFLSPIVAIRGRSHIHAVRRELKLAAGEDPTRKSEEELEAVP